MGLNSRHGSQTVPAFVYSSSRPLSTQVLLNSRGAYHSPTTWTPEETLRAPVLLIWSRIASGMGDLSPRGMEL